MARGNNTKINIILDGNSIPNAYSNELTTQLNALYGAGNYTYYNACVGGQTIDDMVTRINIYIKNNIQGFASKNILIFQELRNQMQVGGSTPAQTYAKAKTYCQTVRAALPSTCSIKIGLITAIADDDQGANIPAVNALCEADTSGDWDFIIDLYNLDGGAGATFANSLNTNPWYSGGGYDGTHPNSTGETAAGDFVGTEVYALYP